MRRIERGGCGSSSYGGSYGEPRRERPVRKTSVIKDMTVELYTQADRHAELVDEFYEACGKSGRQIPAGLRTKLDAIKKAAKDYTGLVDFYTGG